MKALHSLSISRGNAILVIVDMQNEFCKPGGKLFSHASPDHQPRAQTMPGVISAIRGLAERARGVGIPIIYIQSVRTLQEPEFTVFGHEPMLEIRTQAVEIIDELKPHERDIVVQKFSHDPFFNTDLDQELHRLVHDPTQCYAVVTGGGIAVCAYHAAMGFHLRDYWTVVPVDCVYYSGDADYQGALEQLSSHAYPNIFLSRSDLIEVSTVPTVAWLAPIPGT